MTMPGANGPLYAAHQTPLDANTALEALVYAQGQPALAAERLGLKDADSLLAAIVVDEPSHDKMRAYMRAFTMVKLLGIASNLEDILMERVDELDARDVAKLFTSVLALADLMTRGATTTNTNINIHETLMRVLPPDVRAAFRVIQADSVDMQAEQAEQDQPA